MPWPSSFPAGTLGYLKDRISDELMRSDLTTQIASAIDDAIKIYQKKYLRFNETFTATFRTKMDQQNYTLLSDISFSGVTSTKNLFSISKLYYTQNLTSFDILRAEPDEIILANQVGTIKGPPEQFAFMNETIMLTPVPDQGQGDLGAVTDLLITAPGSGYASGIFTAPLTGGTGSGLTGLVTITAGAVTGLSVVAPGQGYTVGDFVSALSSDLGVAPLGPVTGQIAAFTLLSGGFGYMGGFFVAVALTGGHGTGATGNIIVTPSGGVGNTSPTEAGSVTDVQIVNPGSGYEEGDLLSADLQAAFSGGSQSGQVGNFTIIWAGTGGTNGVYTNQALTGGSGAGATADFTVAGGVMTVISIFNPGIGYQIGDTLTVPVPGTASQIASTNLVLGGFGYTDGTFINHALTGGTGAGATGNITVVGNTVTNVVMNNRGTGYSSGDLLSATGGGMGAGFGLALQVLDVGVTISVTSLTLGGVPGLIASLSTLVGGSSYTNGTYNNIPLTGGTGSGALANIIVSGGSITSIALVSPGQNYTVGNVLTAVGLGPGTGFSVTVASITTGAVTQSSASGFQIQVTNITTGAAVTSISGSGFIAQVTGAITVASGYAVTILGQVTYGPPLTDSTTGNRWMESAERLIRARAKYIIATHVTRNAQMAAAMSPFVPGGEAYEAERELVVEAGRLVRRGRVSAMPF